MLWANFLHIYQPPDQKKFIMDKVVSESYRAIISILRDNPHARITMSVIGCLMVKLDKEGYGDVVDGLRELGERGQIEFTAGTMYHPFLPKLPDSEIVRQINLNNEIQQYYLGSAYQPIGFYSPEAAYSYRIMEIAHAFGYRWTIVDEISFSGYLAQREYDYSHAPGFYSGGADLRKIVGEVSGSKEDIEAGTVVDYTKLYTIKGLDGFYVHFRERVISDALASGQITDPDQFLNVIKPENNEGRYLLTGTDGEAYGHHQWQLADMLGKLYHKKALETITLSELPDYFPIAGEVDPIPSTWGTSEEEVREKNNYARWHHIDNEIHDKQWELTELAINSVKRLGECGEEEVRIQNTPKSFTMGQAEDRMQNTGIRMSEESDKSEGLEVKIQKTEFRRQNSANKKQGVDTVSGVVKNGMLARKTLDESLYSCHYWWASARPWWSIELIERGARSLANVVAYAEGFEGGIREVEARKILVGASAEALRLYQDIVFTAFDWLRVEKVADLSHKHK